MNEQKERADFEAWMASLAPTDPAKPSTLLEHVAAAFAWEARAALTAQGVPADLVRAAESIEAAVGTLAEGLEGHLEALDAPLIALRAALAAAPAPAQAQHYATTDGVRCDNCGETLSAHTEGGRACPAPSQAQQAEPLTGCNCRWNGDEQVQWCELHAAHKEAIHEWAERAKTAEAKLAADWTDVRMELEAAGRDDLSRFVESATEPAQARRANSGSAS